MAEQIYESGIVRGEFVGSRKILPGNRDQEIDIKEEQNHQDR